MLLLYDGDTVVNAEERAIVPGISVTVPLANPRSWSPADPYLYKVKYEIFDSCGKKRDEVFSYAGLRKFHIEGKRFYLNNEPIFLRMVLDQGFYEEGLWTAPNDEALEQDIRLAMDAGFNGARLHQKIFDPRYHYHADRLGFLTFGEFPDWGMGLFVKPPPPQYFKCQSFLSSRYFLTFSSKFFSAAILFHLLLTLTQSCIPSVLNVFSLCDPFKL